MLQNWSRKWGISSEAMAELYLAFGVSNNTTSMTNTPTLSEAEVSALVRLEASQKGARLWRNNVGAMHTENGFLRYGLANDSRAINSVIKSGDLIGLRPVKITNEMVGRVIGQFISREIKAKNWKFKNTVREQAQLKWAQLIVSLGGDACFATNIGTL